MKNVLMPVIICVVFSIALVWIVRSEGERFRKATREDAIEVIDHAVEKAGDEAQELVAKSGETVKEVLGASKDAAESTSKAATDVIREATKVPGEIYRDVTKPAPELPTPKTEKPESEAKVSPIEVAAPPDEANNVATPSDHPVSTASKPTVKDEQRDEKPAEPLDPISILFKTGHELSKKADEVAQQAFALNDQEEVRYGRDVHEMISRDGKMWNASVVKSRLQRLAKPLLESRSRKNITFSIYLLDDPEVNAFSHLGGYLYVTRGLIALKPSDAELEAVLGHEIAHVDLKHCVSQLTYAARASELGGDQAVQVVHLAYQLIALGYSEDKEFEADAWSFKTMRKLGRSKSQCLEFLQRMAKSEERQTPQTETSADANPADRAADQVRNHFQSHPPTVERIKRLENLP